MFQERRLDMASLPEDLKFANRARMIQAFLARGIASAVEIADDIGVSRQTVMKSIRFFQASGLLVSVGKGQSTTIGGKRPEQFELSGQRYFVCMTVWPGMMGVAIYTIGHRLMASEALNHELPASATEAVTEMAQMSLRMLKKLEIDLSDVCAVSVSTSGVVDKRNGVLRYSSNSPQWGTDFPLRDELLKHFAPNTIVYLENAGKMTARPLGEEPELSDKRILTVFTGWGLSGCLIERKHILNGRNALIGEIGHMMIDPEDKEQCGCGSHGCLERLMSMKRIRAKIQDMSGQYPDSCLLNGDPKSLDIRAIFDASTEHDALADTLVRDLAQTFASALRNISLVFDPDIVVFQGDYAYANELFRSELQRSLQTFRYYSEDMPFDLRYDRRDLMLLNAEGSYLALANTYFSMQQLYQGV